MFLVFIQFIILSVIFLFLYTQIIMPFLKGTPFLPLFSKEVKLERTLEKAKQKVEEVDYLNKIKKYEKIAQEKLKK